MAGFRTHITVSTLTGIGYGAAAHMVYQVPLPTCILAGGLCSVSGMLPDLDSDSGVPLRESVAFGAAVVPMMLMERLRHYDLATETIVLIGALVYLAVRFGFARILKKYSVHRGMFHSIPAALLAAEFAFLLATGSFEMRVFKAGGVLAGYMSHLVLDEIWSVEWIGYRFRLKKSFGTAVKLWGDGIGSNLLTYAGVGLLTYMIFYDCTLSSLPGAREVENVARTAVDQYLR
jgi:membrane-bound metal-dependent hydrolase YbcI (DUF457 family)